MGNPGPLGLPGVAELNGTIGEAGLSGLGADLKSCQYHETLTTKEIKQGESFPSELAAVRTIQDVSLFVMGHDLNLK